MGLFILSMTRLSPLSFRLISIGGIETLEVSQ